MVDESWKNSVAFYTSPERSANLRVEPRRAPRDASPSFVGNTRTLWKHDDVLRRLAADLDAQRMQREAEKKPAAVRTTLRVPALRDNAIDTINEFDKCMTFYGRALRKRTIRDTDRVQNILRKEYVAQLRTARQFVVDEATLASVGRRSYDENPGGARLVHQLLAAPHDVCWFECSFDGESVSSPYDDTHETYHVGTSYLVTTFGDEALLVQTFDSFQYVPRHRQFGASVRTETLPCGVGFVVVLEGCGGKTRALLDERLNAASNVRDISNAYVQDLPRFLDTTKKRWYEDDACAGLREHVYPVPEMSHLAYAHFAAPFLCGRAPGKVVLDGMRSMLQLLATPVNPMQLLALIAHINAAAPPERTRTMPPAPDDGLTIPTHVDYRERTVVKIELDRTYEDFARRARRSIRIIRRRKRHEVRGYWRHLALGAGCTHDWGDVNVLGQSRRQTCAHCGGTRTWVPKHERGDSTLGYVVHTYDVVLGRTVREEI